MQHQASTSVTVSGSSAEMVIGQRKLLAITTSLLEQIRRQQAELKTLRSHLIGDPPLPPSSAIEKEDIPSDDGPLLRQIEEVDQTLQGNLVIITDMLEMF